MPASDLSSVAALSQFEPVPTAVAFGLELITADRGLASLVGVEPRRVT